MDLVTDMDTVQTYPIGEPSGYELPSDLDHDACGVPGQPVPREPHRSSPPCESARVRERDLAETSPTRRLYEVACEAIADRHAAQGKHIPSAH